MRTGVDRATRLLLVTEADSLAATRRLHGRLAAALCMLTFSYCLLVLPTMNTAHRPVQLALIAVCLIAAAVCWAAPWERLPGWATAVPMLAGLLVLSVGTAGLAGALEQYIPCVAVLFAYVAVTQPSGSSVCAGSLLSAGVGAAMVFGRQHAHPIEIFGAIAALALLSELTAAAITHARTQHREMQTLYGALSQLLASSSTAAAAGVVADLTGQLLDADGSVMLLSDAPGSNVYRGAAGAGLGADFPAAQIDVASEASGVAQCVHTAARIAIADAPSSPMLAQRFIQRFHVGSALYIPVRGEGGVLGVLIVWWAQVGRALDHTHDDALELLSTQAGQVLERLRAVARLGQDARTDPLTGVGNRREFLDAAAALDPDGGVLLLDLDHFKPVNDTHGHAVGDEVLVAFARALASCVRDDVVCRVGGDEFAVVLRHDAPKATQAVLRRLARAWDCPHGVTYCHGSAEPLGDEPASVTIARADAALYRAKSVRPTTLLARA
jgi:diguanylate cyclase (GGDEF)-like protein